MAQEQITYNDKSNPVPIVDRQQQATAEDFQDIKDTVNSNAQDTETRLGFYPFTFENADLVSGVLSVPHNLNTGFPKVTLRRPDGTFEEPTQIMVYIDANNINLDFGGPIAAGTWNGLVTYR